MKNGRNSFVIHQKKVLQLRGSFYTVNKQACNFSEAENQGKMGLIEEKNMPKQKPSVEYEQLRLFDQQILLKDLTNFENVQNHTKPKTVSKSLQTNHEKTGGYQNNKRFLKSRLTMSMAGLRKQNHETKQTKLSMGKDKEQQSKIPISIISLLKFSKHKSQHTKQFLQLKQSGSNSNQIEEHKKNLQTDKIHNKQPVRKSNYLKLNKENRSSHFSPYEDFSHSTSTQSKKIDNIKLLSIQSNLVQITINPTSKKDNLVDAEVQTYQTEPQFFQYLVYKRKKQQLQAQLENLFNQFQMIKKDRALYEQRQSQIQQNYKEPAENEREKRIFKLKKEINLYQQKITNQINKKYRIQSERQYQNQEIQSLLVSGLEKLSGLTKNYFKLFSDRFDALSEQKYARMASRLQTLSCNFFQDLNAKIQSQIEIIRQEKTQSVELKQCFNEYTKSIREERVLLKNCFSQFKELPQLFYKLFGGKLSQTENIVSTVLSTLGLAESALHINLPKCLQCYDMRLKMQVIRDTNVSMRSVLKVADQLVN